MQQKTPTLASFGCSFIFGSDLPDTGWTNGKWNGPSNLSWPALVSFDLSLAYDCRAKPGSGNLQIAETLNNHLAHGSADIYVIGWTWIDRFDYVDESADRWDWNPTKWRTILPATNSPISEFYYRHLNNEYQDKFISLLMIKSTIDLLIQHRKPFIMTYMDHLLFDRTWHISPAVLALQDYCKPYMQDFDGMDFLSYSKSRNFPISETLHPLYESHRAAADIFSPAIKDLLVKKT
jgi:hypothetical protein